MLEFVAFSRIVLVYSAATTGGYPRTYPSTAYFVFKSARMSRSYLRTLMTWPDEAAIGMRYAVCRTDVRRALRKVDWLK